MTERSHMGQAYKYKCVFLFYLNIFKSQTFHTVLCIETVKKRQKKDIEELIVTCIIFQNYATEPTHCLGLVKIFRFLVSNAMIFLW